MTDREALVERALVAFLKEFHRKAGTTSWTRGWIRDSLEAALAGKWIRDGINGFGTVFDE